SLDECGNCHRQPDAVRWWFLIISDGGNEDPSCSASVAAGWIVHNEILGELPVALKRLTYRHTLRRQHRTFAPISRRASIYASRRICFRPDRSFAVLTHHSIC